MLSKKVASTISFSIVTLFAYIPFTFIIGSKASLFSYSSMVVPAFAYNYSLVYVILLFFTKSLLSFSFPWYLILHRLPLFFASIALQKSSKTIFIGLPLLAMILFSIHPVGYQAIWYTSYWIIPMIVYVSKKDTIYSRAFAASFIAHAIGSVVWLYTGFIPVQTWMALIPLVIVERTIIAFGMVGFIYLFKSIDSLCRYRIFA